MTNLLLIGLLVGVRHALDADHVAAVTTLATRSRSVPETIRHATVWGLGHSLTLLVFGSGVLLLDQVIPATFAQALEFAVGLMLVVLGVDVFWRLRKEQPHGKGQRGSNDTSHGPVHSHRDGFPVRALFIGLMHGMAGSAALILLALQTVDSALEGLGYIVLFGIGSMIGQ